MTLRIGHIDRWKSEGVSVRIQAHRGLEMRQRGPVNELCDIDVTGLIVLHVSKSTSWHIEAGCDQAPEGGLVTALTRWTMVASSPDR